jgi:hypothetical protein
MAKYVFNLIQACNGAILKVTDDNDKYRKDGTAGGTFVFSIHFPSMKFMEHDHFSKGRMMAGLMDKIQHAADRYFEDYVNGNLDEFGDKKNEL